MKISPKFVLKVAGTLTVIALVTAALLKALERRCLRWNVQGK